MWSARESECSVFKTHSQSDHSHHPIAVNLVHNSSISYLDCCSSLLTGLSASTLHPTSFSLHSSQRDPSKLNMRLSSAPHLQWLHTLLRMKPRPMPWPSSPLQSSPSPALQSYLYFSFSRSLGFKPTTFLIVLNMPSMLLWCDLCTYCFFSPVICFLWFAPSLRLDLSSMVMFSESASINTPFYYFYLHTCSFFFITWIVTWQITYLFF